jgi:ABC-2 type transport system permease protein
VKAAKVVSIARREYIERVRSKGFIFTTLLVPGLLALYAVLFPAMTRVDVDELRIKVVDAGTGLGDALTTRLADIDNLPLQVQETESIAATDLDAVRQRSSDAVRNDEIDGYIVLTPDADTFARSQYYARETGNPLLTETLESAVESTILENWFTGEDLTRIRQAQRADMETITVSSSGEERGGFLVAYASTMILGFLLYITVLMHGQQMAMAIVEEKNSRLVELIIGAVTSTEYMAGKVLGVLGTGLTQLSIWLLMVAITILGVLPGLAMGAAVAELDLTRVLDVGALAAFSLFFFLGYLLYATLFAAIGATCDSVQDMQQAMMPAMMPVILGFLSMFYIMTNPNAFAARLLSLFPYFTPLTMFARINVSEPPTWEVALSVVLLVGTIAATVWGAAKVFRATILFHGKRPSYGELVRMARTAS